MGLGVTLNPLPGGPIFVSTGAKNTGLARDIKSGGATPRSAAGIVGKMVTDKIHKDYRNLGDRQRGTNVTETGESVFDRMTGSPKDFFEVLADLLGDARSPVHGIIKRRFDSELGSGKWADIATELFTAELSGQRVVKQDLAAKHDMAPGTLSKVIRTKVKPAVDKLKRDKRFKDEISDIAESAMMRTAHSSLLTRAAGMGGLFIIKDDIEVIFDPFSQNLQVGMGGEWWAGKVKQGKNVFRHRKERADSAYRPVTIYVEQIGMVLRFAIGGGFGQGTTVMLGFK
jgi:hypothetical protein